MYANITLKMKSVIGGIANPTVKIAPFGRWDGPAARPLPPRWASLIREGRLMKYVITLFCLISFSTQLYSGELVHDEEALKMRAYEFMTEGWGGEKIRGYWATHDVKGFFHRVGKVKKESVRLLKREDNPSVNDELHNYQYDGMTVSVYVAHIGREEKIMVDDVVITSPNWPVKYGLVVGTTRKKIEETLGKSMKVDSPREWNYGDGPSEVTYFFDKDNKAISINWHSMID